MAKEKIILVGGGGHCKVVIDAIAKNDNFEIEGIVDHDLKTGEKVLGVEVKGGDEILEDIFKEGVKNAFVCVGSVGDCRLRKKIYARLKDIGFNIPSITHPKAIIARGVEVGEGTFVAASATLNAATIVGSMAIVNTSASIDHDCQIGDFVHIAPGVVLSGGVKIGEGTHVGTGTNITQYVTIGSRCMIKAGRLISEDVPDGSVR